MVTESGECLTAFCFNNIGCIHYQQGKYNLAAHYFRKAIEENDAALNGFPPLDKGYYLLSECFVAVVAKCFTLLPMCMLINFTTVNILLFTASPLSGRPLAVLGVNCRHILLYNLGIQQLFNGSPLAAFDSLLEVVQVYHANPRLWLRLAEASVSAHMKVPFNGY